MAKHRHKSKKSKSEKITARMFHEVKHNVPSTVRRAKVSGKRKKKMLTAIALQKARKAGAKIKKPKGRRV